jgi:hypothetical protein
MRSGGGIEGMATSVIVNQAGMPLDKQQRINQTELIRQAESIKQTQQAQQQ